MKFIIGEEKKSSQEEQYDVEKIIGEQKKGNLTFYKVKWLGYPIQQSTWQPFSNLKNVPEKIRQWKKQKQRKQIQKEMKEELRAMNYQKNNSSSDLTQNKKYKSQQKSIKNSRSQNIKKQTQTKKTQKSHKYHNKANDINGDNQSQSQNPKTSKKKKANLQRVEQTKDLNIKMVTNTSKTAYFQLSFHSKQPNKKIQKQKRQKHRDAKIKKKKTSYRNLELQYDESRQKIIIEISDSQQKQQMIDNQQEIIVQESVSYSSENKQKHSIIDPQIFFNKQTLKHKNQTQKSPMKPMLIKSSKVLSNKNQRRQIQMSFFQKDIQIMPQPGLLQKILSEEGNLNVVAPQKETNLIDFERFTDIDTIRRIDETIYCTVITQNGRTLSQIPYESILHLRHDLIEKFFTIKK